MASEVTTITASICPYMMNKCQMQLFQKTASNGLNSPRHDEKVSNATFSKNGLAQPLMTSNDLGGQSEAAGSNDPKWDLEM